MTTFATLGPELIPVGLLAIGLFIAGFGFKMGLVPFHMWLPDTYEGSPTTISALLLLEQRRLDLQLFVLSYLECLH